MESTAGTKLIQKPDGSPALVFRRVRLSVLQGPDRGSELLLERPRVRIGSGPECELRLTDPAVSRLHLELSATERGLLLRDLGSTNGTLLSPGLRLERAILGGPATILLGGTSLRIEPTDEELEIRLSRRLSCGALLGQSPAIREVFAALEQVGPATATVLLEGESGTGKELAAAALHALSPRRDAPLVTVDCGAIPASLIESELFGHERGAFTGAEQSRAGSLEQAAGGTLFLDEIGELPLELQPRLLRFLESGQVKRLGATRALALDVRVIAATNRNLREEVERGSFRRDLYYRLAVVRIELPPLRERPEDILLLAHHFAERHARDPRSVLTPEIAAMLQAHAWPGNVRELRNVVERLALMPELAAGALRAELAGGERAAGATAGIGSLLELPFHEARTAWQDRFERQYLTLQLERAGGVVAHAAGQSGLPRQTFHRLLRKHGLAGG